MPNATQIVRRRSRRERKRRKGGQTAVSTLLLLFLALLVGGGLVTLAAVGGSAWAYALATDGLPAFADIAVPIAPAPARFYAQDGTLIYEVQPPAETWLTWDELPKTAVNATIAAIAPDYFENDQNVIMAQFLDEQIGVGDSYMRPLIGHRAADVYSKEQVLEWYLNHVYYGYLAFGIEAAAHVYFDKAAADLTLGEAAMLAAIPTDPRRNPIDAYDAAKTAQEAVLETLHQSDEINLDELMAARFLPVQIVPPFNGRFDIIAPHFALYAQQEAEAQHGAMALLTDGLELQTSLNLAWQQQAECVAQAQINRLSGAIGTGLPADQRDACPALAFLPPLETAIRGMAGVDLGANDAAVVMLDPATGAIQAMVGGLHYDGTNHATDSHQLGSAIAPFTYLTALAQGYTAATMLSDIEEFGQSEDGIYRGGVLLRQAMGSGYAAPIAQLTGWVGEPAIAQTAGNLGIANLAIGAVEAANLLELAHAYATIGNDGAMVGRGTDDGIVPTAVIPENNVETREILTPELAYLMNDMLADRRARCDGYGCPNVMELPINRPAAVVLGDGDDAAWTIGYTPELVTAVWVGNSDGDTMDGVTGRIGAAPIWHGLMGWALQDVPATVWAQPDTLVELSVCDVSGQLATVHCPSLAELFIIGTQPTRFDSMYQEIGVNRENGRLATLYTPPELIERRIYQQFPDQLAAWAMENAIPQPPIEYDTLRDVRADADSAAISSPSALSVISGTVTISGTAQMDDFTEYRLSYFKGLLPDNLQPITTSNTPVVDGTLGEWDTSGLDGLYTLLLTVMGENGRFAETSIQLTIDN